MHLGYTSIFLALCSISFADPHQFCACQSGEDDSINTEATITVQGQQPKAYLWAQKDGHYWVGHHKGPGPRFGGVFLRAASGKIDGKTFYDLCTNFGGADSTCFDCSKFHRSGNAIYCDKS